MMAVIAVTAAQMSAPEAVDADNGHGGRFVSQWGAEADWHSQAIQNSQKWPRTSDDITCTFG